MGFWQKLWSWAAGSAVTVDYSSWHSQELLDLWRERSQLRPDARRQLEAEMEARGIGRPAPSAEPPSEHHEEDDTGDEPAGGLRGEPAEDVQLVQVTSPWSLALWTGPGEYALVLFPPRRPDPRALAARAGSGRTTAVVVIDPLDLGWMPAGAAVAGLGVPSGLVWRLGGDSEPEAPGSGLVSGRPIAADLRLGHLRLARAGGASGGVLATWGQDPDGALLIGPRLDPARVGPGPAPTHLFGGVSPDAVPPAAGLDKLRVALVMAGARDVDVGCSRRYLRGLDMEVSVVSDYDDGLCGDAEEVQAAALAGDWARVRELAGELDATEVEQLFSLNVVEERLDLLEELGAVLCTADPENGHAWFLRGVLATLRGDEEGAVALYGRAIEAGVPELRAFANLAALQAQAGALDGALRTIEEGLGRMPDDVLLRHTQVVVLHHSGRAAAARSAFAQHAPSLPEPVRAALERLLEAPPRPGAGTPARLWPDLAARAAGMAVRQAMEGDLPGAERKLRRAWDLDRHGVPDALLAVGHALVEAGEAERALPWYDAFLEEHPDALPVRFGRGLALAALGRGAEAAAEHRLCLEQAPAWQEPRLALVSLLTAQGSFSEAEAELDLLESSGADMAVVMALDRALEEAMDAAGVQVDGEPRSPATPAKPLAIGR